MDAEEHTRPTDEERAEADRRRHRFALVVTAAATVVMFLVLLVLIGHYEDTPMCGTGQDYGPC
ncbi:hypothetical protein [Streptomyces sp. NPDC012510]|uniref:hypothetical protein n=1 Tax=Streptomyces sp. NPDC012510 TaxID=3364838 RepID=UPI0036E358BD